MLPILASGSFTFPQTIDWRVDAYATAMTTPEIGIGFRLASPLSSFTVTGMSAAANPTSYFNTNTTPVLTNSGTWGATPMVLDYWGTGAPPGIAVADYVAFHYRGFFATNRTWAHPAGTTSSVWLCFTGKGSVRVQLNGADILNTVLNYATYSASTLITPNPGDQLDIFYYQTGDIWGGIVGKYVVQKGGQGSASSNITISQYREAPPICSSLVPFSTATAFTLPQVFDASVDIAGPADTPTLKVRVPLSTPDTTYGWRILNNPRRLQYTDTNGVVTTLKRRQLVKFFGGFLGEQYQRFSGHILNFDELDGFVTIECSGIEQRLSTINIQNYPDPISYDTFGYFKTFSTAEPIYGITAYDNWPLEHAIKDLCYRGGIDPSLFYGNRQANNINGTVTSVKDIAGNLQYYYEARQISGDYVNLQRNALYGNAAAGFSVDKPADDTYIYKPNLSRSNLDWARELADALGYDFRSNSLGYIVLQARNNPTRFIKATGGTQQFSATAIQGTYQQYTSPFTLAITTTGARFDIATSILNGAGTVNYNVSIMSGTQVASGTINLSNVNYPSAIFFYDQQYNTNGTNAAVTELYSGKWGTYTVTFSRAAGTVYLDSLLIYDVDPQQTLLPSALDTALGIETLRTQTNAQEAINNTQVIGKIKAAITDQAKEENPNNPQFEYFVSAAADPSSIWDPAASNYVGGKISAVIVDEKISDQDYADWVSKTLLVRQRDPGPSADITHPVIPFLEPRDPITAVDQSFSSITPGNTVYITRITENYTIGTAVSQLATTAYAQIPSYEPRQDLPVAIIDSTFFGQPIINFSVTYPSIDSGTILNPGANLTAANVWIGGYANSSFIVKENRTTTYGSDALGTFILMSGTVAWPPIPSSISIGSDAYNAYKNNPYMKFWHIYDYTSKKIYLPCLAGDGPPGVSSPYSLGGWGMGSQTTIAYTGLDSTLTPTTVYSGVCPFYDPYTSELPNAQLVTVQFDTLISGYYRVSLWDARSRTNPIQVAWLTNPDQDPTIPDVHYQYMTAGKAKQFFWDGVDNIGSWNQAQSSDYAWFARGWFEKDQKPEIGKGFYVWNDKTTQVVAISGQMLGGKLVFNPDHYSQFLIKVECINDAFATAYEQGTNLASSGRVTMSDNLQGVAQGQNVSPKIYIYTHLPPPTTINITGIEDWNPLVKVYDPNGDPYTGTGWTTLASGAGDYGGSFHNTKPVRVTLTANARPGGAFSGNHNYTSFKVNRIVHLNANFLDLTTIWEGQPWHSLTSVERKRVLSRRLTNSTHTINFQDTDYRTGDTLDQIQNKWVFRPFDFQIDVNGQKVPLNYCDYLQLEDIPLFSEARTVGQPRSRLVVAYMNYIFYLSTYIQDRSGRFTWAIDPNFIDYSKICFNTFPITHPEELDQYSVRTIVARQWLDPSYVQSLASQWNISSGTATSYIQFFHNRLAHNDNNAAGILTLDTNAGTVTGRLGSTGFSDGYSNNWVGGRIPGDWILTRQLGDPSNTKFFGKWSWEGSTTTGHTPAGQSQDIYWVPELTRDFHPYALIPSMTLQGDNHGQIGGSTGTPPGSSNLVNRMWYGLTSPDRTQWFNLQDQALNDTWFAKSFPPTNDGSYPNGEKLATFSPGPGHTAEETFGPNPNTPVPNDIINYQRQIEHPHWEDYRGFISTGKFPSNNMIQVAAAAGPYLMNFYKYRDIFRINRVQFAGASSTSSVAFSSIEPLYIFLIATQETFLTNETDTSEGWWDWTFRSKYAWYSDSYFPVGAYGELTPRYLHPKNSPTDWGTPYTFDAGAWVGWKDDHSRTFINGLSWVDECTIDVAHAPLPGNFIGSETNNNIFLTHSLFKRNGEILRMPLAIGPRLPESKDVAISLALVNSRRSIPIVGI